MTTEVRHFGQFFSKTGAGFLIASPITLKTEPSLSFQVISQITGVKISLSLVSATLQCQTLKNNNLPRQDDQIRKKAFMAYKITYSSWKVHKQCQHLEGAVNSSFICQIVSSKTLVNKFYLLPFWMTGQEFTYQTSGENHFWQEELSWQEYTNTGPYGVLSWDEVKGSELATLRSLFPFWMVNLMLPELTQEIRAYSHCTNYTGAPQLLSPLGSTVLGLILLCFSVSQGLTSSVSLYKTIGHIVSLHQLFLEERPLPSFPSAFASALQVTWLIYLSNSKSYRRGINNIQLPLSIHGGLVHGPWQTPESKIQKPCM